MTSKKKTVSLALGSGGARGLAHIGIINWLEENGYEVSSIAGTSIGALVGGIYAFGKLAEYEKWVRTVTTSDMLGLLDVSLGSDGIIKGDKIIAKLKSLVGDCLIEDLSIPFTAVAANISKGKEVWIDEGPVFDAIRASISLPLLFTPVQYKGETLIDGGILNPVPIAPTFNDPAAMTIAVNLCAKPVQGVSILSNESGEEGVSGVIAEFVDKIKSMLPESKERIKAYDIVSKSFDAMQGTIARQKIAAYPPDYVVEIPRNLCRMIDFDMASEIIQFGYDKAEELLPKVLETAEVKARPSE